MNSPIKLGSLRLGERIKNRIIRKEELNEDKSSIIKSSFHAQAHPQRTNHYIHHQQSLGNITASTERPKLRRNQTESVIQEGKTPQNVDQLLKPLPVKYYHQVKEDRINGFYNKERNGLDVRDERILIPFESKYYGQYRKSNYAMSIQPLKDEMRDWLIDVIEIVTSISFNHLKLSHLTEKETKNFAAKNIILNVKEFFESHPNIPVGEKYDLVEFINQQTTLIFKSIIGKYPQTNSKGASKRVMNKIGKVNIRDSDEYDFLYKNSIKVEFNKKGDYSEYIMKVINRLIASTSDIFHPNDQNEETNYEVFSEIMEHIFNYSAYQDIPQTIAQISQMVNRKRQSRLRRSNSYGGLQSFSLSDKMDRKSSIYREPTNKDYLIGQKIPSDTRLFNKEELQGSSFKVNHSSILRILTKWAEQLRGKLQNAQENILKRLYKFKTKNGQFLNLQLELKEIITQYALNEQIQIQKYMKYLKAQNIYLQSTLLEELNIGKHSKHDVKAGILSAKLTEIASQYIFRYINKLIHSLMTIPKEAAKNVYNQTDKVLLEELDLVTLKIGDLMRCKCACTEQEFIKILATFQELQNEHPEILKILRIKNRLDLKDNDILINVFFMNRMECEVQLSIKGTENKTEKDYSNFNHFIYQIIRAQFGPLSEMANIIGQYDPLVNQYCKKKNISPDLLAEYGYEAKRKYFKAHLYQFLSIKKKLDIAKFENLPFICCKCMQLSIIHNPLLIYKDPSDPKFYCNHCKGQILIQVKNINANEYVYNNTFKNNKNKQFFNKHMIYWHREPLLQKMKEQENDQCDIQDMPSFGMYVKINQKLPILKIFNTSYESNNNVLLFGEKTKNDNKIFLKIPLYNEKNKRVKAFQEQLSKVNIFRFLNVKKENKDGKLYLSCKDDTCNCTHDPIQVGPFFPSQQMVEYQKDKNLQNTLLNDHNIWNFHDIPKIFDKVQSHLRKAEDGKMMRIIKNIEIIFAYNCSLTSIKLLSKFPNILDLYINDNPQLSSLHGLQNSQYLRNLDCRNCGLMHLGEIKNLKNLEYLNISSNKNFMCISGLQNFTELKQLFMANTAITNLQPLQKMDKLEYLDIEGCVNVKCLNSIKSEKIIFINIIGCTNLKYFDLPKQARKSLKKVNYSNQKNDEQKISKLFDFVLSGPSISNDSDSTETEQQQVFNYQDLILTVNAFLKSQIKMNDTSETMGQPQRLQKQLRKCPQASSLIFKNI